MNIEELIFVEIPIAIIKKFGYFKKLKKVRAYT